MKNILIGVALILLELVLFSFGAVLRPLLESKGALGGLGVALVLGVPFYWFLETIKWMRGKEVAIGPLKITAAIYTVVVGGFLLAVGSHGSTPQPNPHPQPQTKSGLQSAERISLICFARMDGIDFSLIEQSPDDFKEEFRIDIVGQQLTILGKQPVNRGTHTAAAIDNDHIVANWPPTEVIKGDMSTIRSSSLKIARKTGDMIYSVTNVARGTVGLKSTWTGHCGLRSTETGK